jgi:hypothetical protein
LKPNQLAEQTGSYSNSLLEGTPQPIQAAKIPDLRDKTKFCLNASDSAVLSKTIETEADKVYLKGQNLLALSS